MLACVTPLYRAQAAVLAAVYMHMLCIAHRAWALAAVDRAEASNWATVG